MQQIPVGDAVVPRRRRKFLALRNLGIGVGFEKIRNAIGREAEIDAGIAIELDQVERAGILTPPPFTAKVGEPTPARTAIRRSQRVKLHR